MFARLALIALTGIVLWAMLARSSHANGPEQHYRVKAADTLWSIASAHYSGDPREGIYELQHRNGLEGTTITPGQVLVLP